MSEAIDRVLERVAQELWLTPGIDCEVESEWVPLVSGYLKGRLGPLLEAGQAMRKHAPLILKGNQNFYAAEAKWDAALAPAQAGKEPTR
jgi:hypothetical protein